MSLFLGVRVLFCLNAAVLCMCCSCKDQKRKLDPLNAVINVSGHMDSASQTQVVWKSRRHSQLLNHLSQLINDGFRHVCPQDLQKVIKQCTGESGGRMLRSSEFSFICFTHIPLHSHSSRF